MAKHHVRAQSPRLTRAAPAQTHTSIPRRSDISTAWAHLARGLGAEQRTTVTLSLNPAVNEERRVMTSGPWNRQPCRGVLTHIARTHVTLKHPSFDPNLRVRVRSRRTLLHMRYVERLRCSAFFDSFARSETEPNQPEGGMTQRISPQLHRARAARGLY